MRRLICIYIVLSATGCSGRTNQGANSQDYMSRIEDQSRRYERQLSETAEQNSRNAKLLLEAGQRYCRTGTTSPGF